MIRVHPLGPRQPERPDAARRSPVRLLTRLATSRWRAGTLVVAMLLSTWALFTLDALFALRTGAPTPDTQNALTLEQAVSQLAAWDDGSRQLYALFAAVDFVFPLASGLVLTVVAYWLVVLGNRHPGPAVPTWVALLCLLPVPFDYAENVGFLAALATGGQLPLQVALIAKALKLTSITLSAGVVVVLAVVLVVRFAVGRIRAGAARRR